LQDYREKNIQQIKMNIREYSRKKNRIRKIPNRYVPQYLSSKDKQLQLNMLKKSRRMYKNKKYFTRKRVASFKNKKSSHIQNAERIYGVKTVVPSQELARKTGCSLNALNQIVKKGEGAYYSSGSRPNQTARSWGLARLASSVTGGNAAIVDFHILKDECDHKKKAYILAKKRMK
jgi:hypothetical protein